MAQYYDYYTISYHTCKLLFEISFFCIKYKASPDKPYRKDQRVRTFASFYCFFAFGDWPPGQSFSSVPLLRSIRSEKSSDAKKVLFELNGFYPPEFFGLTGNQPRVVCDFKKANLEKSLPKVLETNGTFILRIRVGNLPPSDPKIRVVLDLVPHKNYDMEQNFFKKDTTFALILHPENANKTLRGGP